ncbi:MAG: hypothetical protein K2I39_08180, partial [Muribaculaceae bacterium]|nr:hypothetical protein [Muribaculaceae bacterium]
ADYAARVKKELKEIGQNRQIPGFRKGHVDMAQLQKRFGKQVKAGVLNDVASDAALKYIEDNKIAILGQPIPAEENEMNLDEKDFTFVYEIGMMPELNMVFDQNVELDYYNIAVSDEMVAEQDKNIRMQAGDRVTTDTYGDRALVKGTIMQLAEDGQVKADGIQVTDGIVAPFLFKSKEEAAKFEGTKAGDKVVFDAFATCDGNEAEIASMLHIDRDRVEEARGNFEMTITEYVVNKPAELGQEFYDKVFGADAVHNEEEYFARVRDMIAQSLQPNSRSLFVRMTEDYLMETYGANMQLPEGFLRKFMVRVNPEIKAESVDEELKMAIPGMKWEIIEGQAGRVMGVKVEEDDVKAIARSIAMEQLIQYGMGQMAEQMADYYAENLLKDKDQRRRLVDQAYTSKLMNAIHNAVKLNEKTVSLDEFRALVDTLNNASGAAVAAEE